MKQERVIEVGTAAGLGGREALACGAIWLWLKVGDDLVLNKLSF